MDRNITILYPSDIEPYNREMRLLIVQALLALKTDPEAQPLLKPPKNPTALLGDLGKYGCRSWPIAGEYSSTETRIVYRILKDDSDEQLGSIEVVAIGRRFRSLCFMMAWSRLHGTVDPKSIRRFRPDPNRARGRRGPQ